MTERFKDISNKTKAFYNRYYERIFGLLTLLYFALSWLFCLPPVYCFALFFTGLIILEVLLCCSYFKLKRDLIDRLFILCIIFLPLVITQYLFLHLFLGRSHSDNINFWAYYIYESNFIKKWFQWVPNDFYLNKHWFQWGPIIYLITIGVAAYFIEIYREKLRHLIQWLTRFAPAVVAFIFIAMSGTCFLLIYLQTKKTADFSIYEFKSQEDVQKLCKLVDPNGNKISSIDIKGLNEFLCTPNFYERMKLDKNQLVFSENINNLVKERDRYEPRLVDTDKTTIIKKLNRLILEEVYYKNTPQSLSFDCYAKNAVWLFCMIFFGFCPVLCFIPVIVIISKITTTEKTNRAANLKSCFFKFYKIFFIETPVTISCGCFFLILGIVLILINSPSSISKEPGITMWQMGFELSKFLTPIILLVTPFSVAIRDFDRLFVSDYQRRVCHIIATMRRHKIVLGYGYLSREVLAELKERRIVDHRNVVKIITPTLQERKFYKDLLIIDKDRNVFSTVFDDPIYGTIGIIEPAIVQVGKGQQKTQKNESIESILIIGVVGDHGKTILERANISEASLFISTIPDYEATNTLIKVLSDKKYTCSCIVTIQDDHQFKLQLPYIYNEVADSKSLILLYPSYLEGVELGRLVLLAAKKWQQNIQIKKLPNILICGSGKQIYYIIQTYLLGLQQLSNTSIETLKPLNIRILSDERFYSDNIKVDNSNKAGMESRVLNENFALLNSKKELLQHKIYISDPRDKKNLDIFLRNNKDDMPHIIVISHKIAWDVLRILRSWCDSLSQMTDYKPVILVGNKGEDIRLADCLANYAKKGPRDTSFPIQDHDADSGIYRDARGLIASMAESLTSNHDSNGGLPKDANSLSLHFYVSTHANPLSYLCNKLSGLINVSSVDPTSWKLTFTNTRVYNCPGSLDLRKDRNNRFIIETDVVIKQPLESERKNDENVICKGLIMPKCRKQTVEGLIGTEKDRKCFNKYCDLSELCHAPDDLHKPTSNGSNIIAIARIKVCSDLYNTPGSVARSLNSLKLHKTVVNADFFEDEFESKPNDVKNLCDRIKTDSYGIDNNYFGDAKPNTCQWLNKFLTIPAFYGKLINKNPNMYLSDEIKNLTKETDNYRQIKYCVLNDNQKYSIKKLNRLLLKTKYPNETPEIFRTVINLTGIRSYYCLDPSTSRIELYGNKTKIKYDEWQQVSNISHVSIFPVTNKDLWSSYGKYLSSFLNKNISSVDTSTGNQDYTHESNDINYIKITKWTHKHNNACPGTCSMGKREKYKRL